MIVSLMTSSQITNSSTSVQQNNQLINVTRSKVIDNIQFNYSTSFPSQLEKSLLVSFKVNYSVTFLDISSSTSITKAVPESANCIASRDNKSQDQVLTYYELNPFTQINIQNNTVTFNQDDTFVLLSDYNQANVYLSPVFTFSYSLNFKNDSKFVSWEPFEVIVLDGVYNTKTTNTTTANTKTKDELIIGWNDIFNTKSIVFDIFVIQIIIITLVPLLYLIFYNRRKDSHIHHKGRD